MSTLALTDVFAARNAHTEESLSDRLVHAMRLLGISQSELARRIGVKPQTIQYLCTGHAARSKFSSEIADALGVNTDWLTAGLGRMMEISPIEKTIKIPIIDWFDILIWLEKNDVSIKIDYIDTRIDVSDKSFALKINDSSMAPRFELGTVLIIDPTISPKEKDFVVVSTEFSTIPILRQLIKKDGVLFLMPSNTSLFKEVELKKCDTILGVLRQAFYEFIRN